MWFPAVLGLANAAQPDDAASAADTLKADPSDRGQSGQEAGEKPMNNMESGQSRGGKRVTGEVLRVELWGLFRQGAGRQGSTFDYR